MSSITLQLSGTLTLTAAEAAAEAKEQLWTHRRKLPDQAQASDDGFALGLACVLQVCTMEFALTVITVLLRALLTAPCRSSQQAAAGSW